MKAQLFVYPEYITTPFKEIELDIPDSYSPPGYLVTPLGGLWKLDVEAWSLGGVLHYYQRGNVMPIEEVSP